MMRTFWIGITMLIAAGVLVGCTNGATPLNGGERVGMDMQEAAARADEIMDDVLNEINPEVKWTYDTTSTGSCDITRRRAVMTIISADRRGNFLGVVDRYWRKSGYKIKAINNDVDVPAIYAQTSDGFGVSLIIGSGGQVHFEVDSPCVEVAEVSEPVAAPNGPTYEGMENIPRPNVHSDFWSAGAP